MKLHIASIKEENLINLFEENNIKSFHAKQVFSWLHNKYIFDIDNMSNISKEVRELLKTNFNYDKPIIEKIFTSDIDDTKKFLIKLNDNNIIETVLMNYSFGKTICISSQIGCNMGCKFCASTIGGLIRNLDTYELLAEVYLIEDYIKEKINNIVIMGIGEPLNNLDNILSFLDIISSKDGNNISKRNVTISTCGIVPNIINLSNDNSKFTLALSLHASNDEIRKKIMPIASKYSIKETLDAMGLYYKKTKRRITLEYSLIDNVNSSIECANELSSLLFESFIKKHIDFNVNLIPVNEVEETHMKRPCKNDVMIFKKILEDNFINVTIRRELGKDISGSCGQLRRRYI